MKKILLLFSFGLITAITNAQTIVPGGVVSGTWTNANSPYLVQGAIMIANGTTLSIDPGVRVEFQGDYKFLVLGQLLAIGTINDSITFTSTNTADGWLGIRFDSTLLSNDSSKFYYCNFQYGKANGTSMIDIGGAFYFKSFSKVIISNSNISNCFANNNGAGIYCDASSPVISDNIISNNTTPGYGGAGIACTNSQPLICRNTFLNNTATDATSRGGAISFYNCTNAVIDSNIFSGNTAFRGASVFSSGGSPVITNNINFNNVGTVASCIALEFSNPVISQNSFTNNTGGCVIYCEGTNPIISNNDISNNVGLGIICSVNSGSNIPVIHNNVIHNNTAGGISCIHSSPIISHNFITNNTSLKGGAIKCLNNTTPVVMSNNVIANNSADSLGGAIYCNNSSPELSNNTITNNSALVGGALYCTSSSDPSFSNTIMWGNTAAVSGNEAYLFDEASDPNFSYCDIEGGSVAFGVNANVFYLGSYNNNMDLAAQFIAPSAASGTGFNGLTANWALMASSPCIDAGNLVGVYPLLDVAGNPRISNARIDIGAYEDLFTGISSDPDKISFNVYPNPSTGKFTIVFPDFIENGKIEIYSVLGERIFNLPVSFSSSKQISIPNISQGIYFLKLHDGENCYYRQINIELH